MKILFVTLYALETNTSVTKSNYGILKGFLELGYDVTLLMPEMNDELSYYDNSLDLQGLNIIRINTNNVTQKIVNNSSKYVGLKKKFYNFVKNIYKKFKIFDRTKCYLKKAKEIKLSDEYFDVVISTSDPKTSHLFVEELIKNGLNYGRWIQHWGDPLAGDISKRNVYPNFYIEKIEKKIIWKADKVIYVSPFTLEVQERRYGSQKHKFHFVPLPCDINSSSSVDYSENKILNIVYLGDYSSNIRNIIPLYNACSNLNFVKLIIAGNTDISLENKKNIVILPRIKQSEAKKIEEKADVIVSIGNLSGNQIPGKIYYSSSSKKHILVTVDGEYKEKMKDYLESYNRFICCDNTTYDISNALYKLKNISYVYYETPEVMIPKNVAKKIIE